jgi:hypothetical protein
MNFANSLVFRIGRIGCLAIWIDMKLRDEFSFASAAHVYRLFASPQTSNQPQIFQRLNEPHPNLNSKTFLGWRLESGSKGVR